MAGIPRNAGLRYKGYAMRVGVNILTLEPGYDEEDVYLRNVLVRMRDIQPDTHFTLLTDENNHNSYLGWDRIFVGRPDSDVDLDDAPVEKSLDRAAKRARVDLVYTPLQTAGMVSAVSVVPYTLDLSFLEERTRGVHWRARPLLREIKRIAARCQISVVPSEYMRKQMLTHLGVPMNKVIVAPPGSDPGLDGVHDTIAQKPYLITLGDTRHRGHLQFLLDVFERLKNEIPHTLIVLGRPDHTEPDDWGPRVLRIHRCPVPQLSGLLQHSAAFICTSLHEGACITILEAMRGGARVITPRVGGIPEIAGSLPVYYNHESVASLVQAVRRVLQESPEERERHRAFSRRRAVEFTWENCAWRTLAAFKRVEG